MSPQKGVVLKPGEEEVRVKKPYGTQYVSCKRASLIAGSFPVGVNLTLTADNLTLTTLNNS